MLLSQLTIRSLRTVAVTTLGSVLQSDGLGSIGHFVSVITPVSLLLFVAVYCVGSISDCEAVGLIVSIKIYVAVSLYCFAQQFRFSLIYWLASPNCCR